jgi:hypothetical protein
MSPDDIVMAAGGNEFELRAHQNVVFELGFWLSMFRGGRIIILVTDDLKLPPDLEGVLYHRFDGDSWRQPLGRALEQAGFEIDWKRALQALTDEQTAPRQTPGRFFHEPGGQLRFIPGSAGQPSPGTIIPGPGGSTQYVFPMDGGQPYEIPTPRTDTTDDPSGEK